MIITLDLILTGVRAGLTCNLNGKQFVQGRLRLRGSNEQLEPVIAYYGRAYHAFPHGSVALQEAQARDAAEAAKLNGNNQADAAAQQRQANGVLGAVTNDIPRGNQAPAGSAAFGAGLPGAQAGGAGVLPVGDGHTDAGLRAGQVAQQQQQNANGDLTKIRAAVLTFDPDVKELWTADGKPMVDAVAQTLNDASITRKQIDAAAGDWSRDQAVAQKAAATKAP
jgi:hypothetical protein